MDDEFIYHELKSTSSALGSINANLSSLKENMDKMCDWKDNVLENLQQCNDYMSARQDIPKSLNTLEKDHEKLKGKVEREEESNKIYREKTDYLVKWSWKVSGAVLLATAISMILTLIKIYMDIQRGL